MKKFLIVAKWEYLEKIKTKSFIISMILFPLIMIGMSVIPGYLASKEDSEIKVFGFIQQDLDIFEEFNKNLEKYKLSSGQPNYLIRLIKSDNNDAAKLIADSLVFSNLIKGYILIEKLKTDSVKIEFRGENVSNVRDLDRFEKAINQILTDIKIKNAGLDEKLVKSLHTNFEIKPIKISKTGEEKETSFMEIFLQGYLFTLLLMMMIVFTGGMLVRSVVEEKSNRIIEVIVSSCSAMELMAGKIIGLSALGLTQFFIWIALGISLAGPVGASFLQPGTILLTLIYFSLGYVLYSAIFVAVGSLANSEQEAQQFTGYISMLLIFPVIIVFQMMNEPESLLVKILSYFPLTLPPMMTMKVNIITPTVAEILITILIMILSIILMIWIAGKIFRVAILNYGKIPNLKTIISIIKNK